MKANGPLSTWTNLETFRSNAAMFGNMVPVQFGCSIEATVAPISDNHSVSFSKFHFSPNPPQSSSLLVYMHGGGFIAGSVSSYSGFVCTLSRLTATSAISIEYRRAPEHRMPAAVDDIVALYRWLIESEKRNPQRIILMGDSAGGALVLLTLQRLVAEALPLPKAGVLLSPITDLALSTDAAKNNDESDFMIDISDTRDILKRVLAEGMNPSDPRVSALFGSFESLPPLYFVVSNSEVLYDDTLLAVEKARAAGVEVELDVQPNLQHVFPLFAAFCPQAEASRDKFCEWIRRKLA